MKPRRYPHLGPKTTFGSLIVYDKTCQFGNPTPREPPTLTLLTKLYEMVGSLSPVDIMTMLVAEVLVNVVEIAERQLRGVGGLTQGQVADTFFYNVAGDMKDESVCVCVCVCVCVRACACVSDTHLLEYKLIAFNTAFGGRLRGEL